MPTWTILTWGFPGDYSQRGAGAAVILALNRAGAGHPGWHPCGAGSLCCHLALGWAVNQNAYLCPLQCGSLRVVRPLSRQLAPTRVLWASRSEAIKPNCLLQWFLKKEGWGGKSRKGMMQSCIKCSSLQRISCNIELGAFSRKHQTIHSSLRFQNTWARKHKIHIHIKRKNR